MTNIVKQLTEEHREVAGLMEALAEQDADRPQVFQELLRNLLSHAKGEEAEFYPKVRELDEELAAKMSEAQQEHRQVEQLLEKMKKVVDDDDRFATLLAELKENVEEHVAEEEGEVFPNVEKNMSEKELNQLGKRYAEARRAAMESIAPFDPMMEKTKAELYEEAKEAEIAGRSQMTKEELAEALSERED